MKKKTIFILTLLICVFGAAIFYFVRKGEKKQKVSFFTVRPEYGYIGKMVTATGTVQPVDTVTVGAQVSGVVKFVYADFNSEVKEGQLLAKVDPSIIQAQADEAKASLVNMQSNLQYQQSTFSRQNRLYELGAISKADFQVALNQFQSARAAVDNAMAQLKMARRNLYYTQIYSPINGVVLNRTVSAGQTIASNFNAPTLFVIARNLTKMQVNANVDEADIGDVTPGQRATFSVDAFPTDLFVGKVLAILLHPAVSANVVTYTTRINIDNPEMKLKPGMTARINIYTHEDSNALLIPSRAINFIPDTAASSGYIIRRVTRPAKRSIGGVPVARSTRDMLQNRSPVREALTISYVWVKRSDTLLEKEIVTGVNDDSNVKVLKGLAPTDDVIIRMLTGAEMNTGSSSTSSPFMPQMRRSQPTRGGAAAPR